MAQRAEQTRPSSWAPRARLKRRRKLRKWRMQSAKSHVNIYPALLYRGLCNVQWRWWLPAATLPYGEERDAAGTCHRLYASVTHHVVRQRGFPAFTTQIWEVNSLQIPILPSSACFFQILQYLDVGREDGALVCASQALFYPFPYKPPCAQQERMSRRDKHGQVTCICK